MKRKTAGGNVSACVCIMVSYSYPKHFFSNMERPFHRVSQVQARRKRNDDEVIGTEI